MEPKQLWQFFLDTGAPEAYLLYCRALKEATSDVSDRSGAGPAGDGLQ